MENIIKKIFLSLGADVCGIANIDSFNEAPQNFHPKDIYNNCKSVIVFGKIIPRGTALVNPRIIYHHYNDICKDVLDKITFSASNEIERIFNAIAVPLPSDGPYDYWDADQREGKGIISMKHAAVLAGLGYIGKNHLLTNSKYGNMLNIGAVLTNLSLPSDTLVPNMCIDGCSQCIDNCPVGAISEKGVSQKLCRQYAYETNSRGFEVTNCNNCRVKCPMALGEKILTVKKDV